MLIKNTEVGALHVTDSTHIADPSKFSKSHFFTPLTLTSQTANYVVIPQLQSPKTTPPKPLSQTLGIKLTTHQKPINNQLTKSSIPASLSTTTSTTFYHHFHHQSFPPVFHQKLPPLRLLTAFSPPISTLSPPHFPPKFFHLLTTKPLPYSSQKFSGTPQKPPSLIFLTSALLPQN